MGVPSQLIIVLHCNRCKGLREFVEIPETKEMVCEDCQKGRFELYKKNLFPVLVRRPR